MIHGARTDAFSFNLPVVFFPSHVKDRFTPYLKRMPSPTDSIVSLVNWSIQSITVPGRSKRWIEPVPWVTRVELMAPCGQ
jgi:hypothetical protein